MVVRVGNLEQQPGENAPQLEPPSALAEICPPKSFVLTDPHMFANQLSAVGFADVKTMESNCP